MKLIQSCTAAALVAQMCLPALAADTDWQIDPKHSAANFSVKHMMVSNVRGAFSKVAGTVDYDGKNLKLAKVEATIDASSINTNDDQRDKHLRGQDFFDAEKFPTITFKSKTIAPAGKGKFKMTGDLTMHGVTKTVTLAVDGPTAPIDDKKGKQHVGASATGKINRRDFGITYNSVLDNGGVAVSDEVQLTLDVELTRPVGAASTDAGDSKKTDAKKS